jgi:hypothetical protein
MSAYWCAECGLPGDIPLDLPRGPLPRLVFACWACCGPVVSWPQLQYWNNLPFQALLNERLAQLEAGEGVELAEFGPGVKFAPGAAADYLLLQALGELSWRYSQGA